MKDLISARVLRRLDEIARTRAEEYRQADPFPHVVIEDFLPEDVLGAAVDRFPKAEDLAWKRYDNDEEIKLEFGMVEMFPDPLRDLLLFLNTVPVLSFLETLTGIKDIIPDAHFAGGGLHQIQRGGKLEIHADFSKLPKWNLERRLNLLLYLNRDWKEEFGGHLELWDRKMTRPVKRVLPVFNRCVIFSTESDAYHGHPHPLACPEGWTRKSAATYYYTNGLRDGREEHDTLFQERPGSMRTFRQAIKSVLPPIITDTLRKARKPKK